MRGMTRYTLRTLALAGAVMALLAAGGAALQAKEAKGALVLADQGYFFVGGQYVNAADGQIMANQMYVEFRIPEKRKHRYPIVMIHGGGQTGTNFLGTPDGREGWAEFFVRKGYAVYVVDQPARARSAYHPDVNGPTGRSTTLTIQQRFTAPELYSPAPGGNFGWPQARLHTQWPGTGVAGDPVFDQFYASQVESAGNAERLNRDAGAALLDRIGPAIILTHSQSGPFGWLIADARPHLVKAVLAAEPSGPPFENAPPPWGTGGAARAWGVTSLPVTYDPPVTDPSQLVTVLEPAPDAPDLVRCRLQAAPARRIPTLAGIPILIFSGEASYHAGYDHCTAKYLAQAGVENDYVRLADVGIHGNGHMIMLEENNLEVADLIARWLEDNVR